MLHHFHHRAPDGIWHTVYRIQGTNNLQSMLEALTPGPAKAEADRLNREQLIAARAAAAAAQHPADRRLVSGFYTNQDAA
jgi:hypothetical protein